jgi:class 3 adenylate cyclase
MSRQRPPTTAATCGSTSSRRSTREASDPKRKFVAVLFSDVKDYSKLNETQLETFSQVVFPHISEFLKDHEDKILELNTWGDAIILVSEDVSFVARFALHLRDFYRNENWARHSLPELNCRIGLHSGHVFIVDDPLRRQTAISGKQITLAARIEPITPVGDVFATDFFVSVLEQNPDPTIAYDDAGVWSLAKAYGDQHLNRLRRHHEPEKSFKHIDKTTEHGPDHTETRPHILGELNSVLLRQSSEISDLKSQLETKLAAFESLSDFLREVICYNQGEFIQYNFRAGELHKTLKDTWRDSPQDLTTLHTLCDDLEKFLYTNLKRISKKNFKFIKQYFGDRRVISPRVCIKANIEEGGEQKIVQLFRDKERL